MGLFSAEGTCFFSVQVEEVDHALHVSVVPVTPARWWSSELSAKFWYEGVGIPILDCHLAHKG